MTVTKNVTKNMSAKAQRVADTLLGDEYKCENCDWTGGLSDLKWPIEDVLDRVGEGEIMPAGECPECGSLMHRDEDFWDCNTHYVVDGLRKRGYTVIEP